MTSNWLKFGLWTDTTKMLSEQANGNSSAKSSVSCRVLVFILIWLIFETKGGIFLKGLMNSPKIVTNFPTSPNLQYWAIIMEYSSSLYYSTLCFALKISSFCIGGVA